MSSRNLLEELFFYNRSLQKREFLLLPEREYSFEEVYQRALCLSQKLKESGVRKTDRIGLCFFNTPDFIVSYFALILIGAVSVCLSPLLRASERKRIYQHAQVRFALVDPAQRLLVDYEFTLEEKIRTLFTAPLLSSKSIELISLIYTSGSTGEPKGVMLSAKNIRAQLFSAQKVLKINPSDRILAILSFTHVFGQMNVLLSSFCHKNAICLLRKFNPQKALAALNKNKISVLIGVPSMYESLLKELEKQEKKEEIKEEKKPPKALKFQTLRLFHTGGAYLTEQLQRKLESKFQVKVQQGYGLTETCSMAFANRLEKIKYRSVGSLINRELDFCLLDLESDQLIKQAFQVGEILISGDLVTEGYFREESLSKSSFRFINSKTEVNKKQNSAGELYFKTGDLAYFDEDQYLYLVGRCKELIIRRGAKIYPLEIEEVLSQIPQIKEVAVLGVKKSLTETEETKETEEEIVKAFLVLESPTQVDKNRFSLKSLRSFCAEHLAKYKIPQEFCFLEELPKTSSGKINKLKLREHRL